MKQEKKAETQICLDVSAAIQQEAGIGRYARRLSEELLRLDNPAIKSGERGYQLFYNRHQPLKQISEAQYLKRLPSTLTELPAKPLQIGNREWRLLLQLAYRFRALPATSFDKRVFNSNSPFRTPNSRLLFHGLDNICPPFKRAASIITVHDLSFLIFPQLHSRGNRLNLKFLLPFCARQADKIIADSGSTRYDLAQWLGPAIAEKIVVVHLGVDGTFFERPSLEKQRATLRNFGLDDGRPYILSVGTIEPRKNQARLVEAFANLLQHWTGERERPRLVLVGKAGWGGEYERIRGSVQQRGLKFALVEVTSENPGKNNAPDVAMLSGVDDQALQALYAATAVVAYPSTYEGFGFPALEALASGAPLVTSNNSSLPEVTGPDAEAALLVDSADTAGLTEALRRILDDPSLAERLRKAGPKRARLFSWEKTARETLAVYESVLKSRK